MQSPHSATRPPARRHTRFRCNQRVAVRYRAQGRDAIAYGRCTVVSKGGVGASLSGAQLEVGQDVSLEIATSGVNTTLALKARVRERRGPNHGFEFLENEGRVTVMLQNLFQPEALIVSLLPATPPLSQKTRQRRYPRFPGKGEITLILQSGADTSHISARLVEIGQGGFRVSHSPAQLALGQQLMAVYAGVSMLCKVVWNQPAGDFFESGLAILEE
jgi:hypothetical protein